MALYLEVRSFTWVVGVLPKRATAGLALNNNPRLLASLSFSFPPLVEGAPAGADGLTQVSASGVGARVEIPGSTDNLTTPSLLSLTSK